MFSFLVFISSSHISLRLPILVKSKIIISVIKAQILQKDQKKEVKESRRNVSPFLVRAPKDYWMIWHRIQYRMEREGVEFCRPMEKTPFIKILLGFCSVFRSDFQNSTLYYSFRAYMQDDIFLQNTSWFFSQTPFWPAWFPSIQILIRALEQVISRFNWKKLV
jgi:hypothetical protein